MFTGSGAAGAGFTAAGCCGCGSGRVVESGVGTRSTIGGLSVNAVGLGKSFVPLPGLRKGLMGGVLATGNRGLMVSSPDNAEDSLQSWQACCVFVLV